MSTTTSQSPFDPSGETNTGDWIGVGDAIALTTSRISMPVEGMHRAIVNRWGGLLGTNLEDERSTVDELIGSMYDMIRLGGTAVGTTIGTASDVVGRHTPLPPVWANGRVHYVQSVFNALWGDQLDADESPLRIGLALREEDGTPIAPTPESLRTAYPTATPRLAVLLHGLGETEQGWHSDRNPSLPEGLEDDGFTVLGLRYNSGLRVAHNGSGVADLLETIVASWPLEVDEIVLIGHSMGGLVARAAIEDATSSGYRWPAQASHLVAIGTPHLGSPIEKGVEALSRSLGWFDVTVPLEDLVATRSVGIKDLRHGTDHRADGVAVHVIAGAVTEEPSHPVGKLFGDLVVRVASATGRGQRRQITSSNTAVFGGRNHARLLDDPEVITHTRTWLTPTE